MPERVAIVGSREYPDLGAVEEYVRSLPADTVFVSGDGPGVDRAAEAEAKHCGLQRAIKRPDFNKYGSPAALFIRNGDIAEDCTRMRAYWDYSPGTADAVERTLRLGKPVEVIGPKGEVIDPQACVQWRKSSRGRRAAHTIPLLTDGSYS